MKKYKINFKINIPFSICIISILVLSLYISIGIYNRNNIKSDYFRLHVVANSNSISDQIIKLKVSNEIEQYIDNLIDDDITKQDVYNNISQNIYKILNLSNDLLKKNNVQYTAKANLGKIHYEEKDNLYASMDKGTYDSLQIVLGDAKGENYWNLIFPNKDNIQNLKGLENILPGITNIYDKNEDNLQNTNYSFKFLEVVDNLF